MIKGVVAGAFDVIHPGYIAMFQETALHCDYLVVLLHDDPSVENPKKDKPILSVEDRMGVLFSIRFINDVWIYKTEEELSRILKEYEFDIRFLGDDYVGVEHTNDGGIPIHYCDRSHGWSSSKFKRMIADAVNRASEAKNDRPKG